MSRAYWSAFWGSFQSLIGADLLDGLKESILLFFLRHDTDLASVKPGGQVRSHFLLDQHDGWDLFQPGRELEMIIEGQCIQKRVFKEQQVRFDSLYRLLGVLILAHTDKEIKVFFVRDVVEPPRIGQGTFENQNEEHESISFSSSLACGAFLSDHAHRDKQRISTYASIILIYGVFVNRYPCYTRIIL